MHSWLHLRSPHIAPYDGRMAQHIRRLPSSKHGAARVHNTSGGTRQKTGAGPAAVPHFRETPAGEHSGAHGGRGRKVESSLLIAFAFSESLMPPLDKNCSLICGRRDRRGNLLNRRWVRNSQQRPQQKRQRKNSRPCSRSMIAPAETGIWETPQPRQHAVASPPWEVQTQPRAEKSWWKQDGQRARQIRATTSRAPTGRVRASVSSARWRHLNPTPRSTGFF